MLKKGGTFAIHDLMSKARYGDMDDFVRKLKAEGYDVISGPRTTGDGYYESCLAVLEGNLIEITV